MRCDLKLDYLAFTFLPDINAVGFLSYELDKYPENLFPAFLDHFKGLKDKVLTNEEGFLFEESDIKHHYSHGILGSFDILVQWDGSAEGFHKGVNVSVPSHGIPLLREALHVDSDQLIDLLRVLDNKWCKVSRIDLCMDDFDKTFRPSDYENFRRDGLIASHFRKFAFYSSPSGETFYCGNIRSDKFMRIYDKDKESKGEIDAVRYEFELHGREARALVDFILGDPDHFCFSEYLLGWFKILDPDHLYNGHNKASSPLLPSWISWLQLKFNEVPTPIHITREYKSTTLEQKMFYVDKYLMPLIFKYRVACESRFSDTCAMTEKRLKRKDWQQIFDYEDKCVKQSSISNILNK